MAQPANASGASFPVEAYGPLSEIEEGSWWFEGRNTLLIWALRRYLPAARDYLEIGCGTGFVLAAIRRASPAMRIVALDPHAQGLTIAADRIPDAELHQLEAAAIPWRERFDLVGAFDVIEHVGDDIGVLKAAREALRPGGRIILTVPQHPWLWSRLDDYAGHRRRYRRRELVHGLKAAGFEPELVTSFVSLALPAMAVTRLVRRRHGAVALERELRVGSVARAALSGSLALERAMIRLGVSLPAGGSLLAVARARK